LKILLAHNFYGSSAPSGENTVYSAEKSLLKATGHKVVEYTRNSDEIRGQGAWGALKGSLSTPWNPFSYVRMQRTIERERPDVMHVHNTFPLLSPAIFHSTTKSATATVLTLHNYRIVCAAAIPMREGQPCTECLDRRSVIPALRYGCYRQSRLATLPLATMIALHRKLGTWQKCVDAFIALTKFQRDQLIAAGLPPERIHIKPHFYPDPPSPLPWRERGAKVLFIGRLGEEKGVRFLIEAWRQWGDHGPALELIGDGPQRQELEDLAQVINGKVRFLGQRPFSETQERLASARLLILPSICFEGFPMVIREAFALGVPMAASRLGSMPGLVQDGRNGVLFEPGNSEDLLRQVRGVWGKDDLLARMGAAAREEFEARYTAEANYRILMDIYKTAIDHRRGTAGRVQGR
jgi:glycosyltransferase involved in cell wall biosynthesis